MIQSLDRGLLILESVAKSGHPVSLAELAELFGIDRSSAFRLADTLKRRGFLAHPRDSKGYVPGPAMWGLVQAYDWNRTLIKTARPYLRRLAQETRESAHLAIREGDEALFIDHVPGKGVAAVFGRIGDLVPLYCTGHGKALLADYGSEQLRVLLSSLPLQAYTPRTITSLDRLAEVCEQIPSQGFVADQSEYVACLQSVAAPVRDRDGMVIGAIGISAAATGTAEEICRAHVEQVVSAARKIELALSIRTRRGSTAPSRQ